MKKLDSKLYFELNHLINSKYKFQKKYPFSFKSLQFQLRLIEIGQDYNADRNLNLIKKRSLRSKKLVDLYLTFYGKFMMLLNNKKNIFFRSNFISSYTFKKIKKYLKNKNFNIVGTGFKLKGNKELFSYIYNNSWLFDILERTSEIYSTLYANKCFNSEVLMMLLKNKAFLSKLECSVEKDIKRVENFFINFGIKSIAIQTDQTPFGYIFVEAANRLKINSCVIAHGNFKSSDGVGYLPLHAENIFVWAEQTKTHIENCLNKKKAIEFIGIKKNIIQKKKIKNKILFVASPSLMYKKADKLDFYLENLKQIQNLIGNNKLVFIPHSQESPDFINKIKDIGIKLSSKNLYHEAASSKIILGAHTSFLFESAQCDIPTIQIKELCFNKNLQKMDNVPQLSIKKIKKLADSGEILNCKVRKNNDLKLEPIMKILTRNL